MRGRPRMVPTFPVCRSARMGALLCPGSLAVPTPQSFGTATGPEDFSGSGVGGPHVGQPRTASRPRSTRLEPVQRLRSFNRRFLTYTFWPRLPDPHRLAVPARPVVVGAASRPPGVPRVGLPPASTGPLRRPGGSGLAPPLGHTELRGAPMHRLRTSRSISSSRIRLFFSAAAAPARPALVRAAARPVRARQAGRTTPTRCAATATPSCAACRNAHRAPRRPPGSACPSRSQCVQHPHGTQACTSVAWTP